MGLQFIDGTEKLLAEEEPIPEVQKLADERATAKWRWNCDEFAKLKIWDG